MSRRLTMSCPFSLVALVFLLTFVPTELFASCGIPPGSRYQIIGFGGGSDGETGAVVTAYFRTTSFGTVTSGPWAVDLREGTDALAFRNRFLNAAQAPPGATFLLGENTCRCGMPTVAMHYPISSPSYVLEISAAPTGPFASFAGAPWPGTSGRSTGTSQVIPCNNLVTGVMNTAADTEYGPISASLAGDILETGTTPGTGVPLPAWAKALLALGLLGGGAVLITKRLA
ncbi:MAG: hypothetical protein HKN21_02310 [Candidatus Eisenbacteria bacterium]|uniref:Uncharacterized protein n=1 Tax=Eiseniibacteriota bacterium TaxID=2212470 RepID=A0A7Y2H137_UNCEI|nr:hypothetical protein [Candidatus Eisenbacteria bacterium]